MTAVIRTEELTKRYRGLCALDRVNLDVQEGAIYALVGPNGAGKTTSIKILMNLISATDGQASVLGTDSKLVRGKSYTQIGYVSENQEIPGWMKVGALLEYLRALSDLGPETGKLVNQAIRFATRQKDRSVIARHEDEAGTCKRSRISS